MRQTFVRSLTMAALVASTLVLGAAPALSTDRKGPTAQERAERTLRDGADKTERAIRKGADQAEKALREGADKVMRALDLMMRSIPQYAAPEMNKNGDIIIRRKKPRRAPPNRPPVDDEDGAST